jgi:hypothetical protein
VARSVPLRKGENGQQLEVKGMQNLIELYEMVCLNTAALSGGEKTAILKARLALGMFARAMEGFKRASAEMPSSSEAHFEIAA